MKKIETKEQAIELAQNILSYAKADTFKPFDCEFYHNNERSIKQNRYYWGVVIKECEEYFKNDSLEIVKLIVTLLNDRSETKNLLHSIFKQMFNENKSSANLDTVKFAEYFDAIRDHMFHQYAVEIPLPEDEFLINAYNEYKKGE